MTGTIVQAPPVIECELEEFVRTWYISTVLGSVVDVAVDESVLNNEGRLNALKTGMIHCRDGLEG